MTTCPHPGRHPDRILVGATAQCNTSPGREPKGFRARVLSMLNSAHGPLSPKIHNWTFPRCKEKRHFPPTEIHPQVPPGKPITPFAQLEMSLPGNSPPGNPTRKPEDFRCCHLIDAEKAAFKGELPKRGEFATMAGHSTVGNAFF